MPVQSLSLSMVGSAILGAALVMIVGFAGVDSVGAATDRVLISAGAQEFTPQRLTIRVGDGVTWLNQDRSTHSLVSAGSTSAQVVGTSDQLLINTTLPPGSRYTHTFAEVGTYYYFCANHNQVWGIVIAEE